MRYRGYFTLLMPGMASHLSALPRANALENAFTIYNFRLVNYDLLITCALRREAEPKRTEIH